MAESKKYLYLPHDVDVVRGKGEDRRTVRIPGGQMLQDADLTDAEVKSLPPGSTRRASADEMERADQARDAAAARAASETAAAQAENLRIQQGDERAELTEAQQEEAAALADKQAAAAAKLAAPPKASRK